MFNDNGRSKFIALMFVITGLVLLMVSFILPWWGYHTIFYQKDSDDNLEYIDEGGFGLSVSSGISNRRSGTSFYIGDFNTPLVFGITTLFLILALIFGSLMGTSLIIGILTKNTIQRLSMILGILALIFCLLAPVIFMVALPGAMKADEQKIADNKDEKYYEPDYDDPTKSFFGSFEPKDEDFGGVTKSRWGGDIGWVLSFISFVMFLISIVMIRPKRAVPPPPPSTRSHDQYHEPEPEKSSHERWDSVPRSDRPNRDYRAKRPRRATPSPPPEYYDYEDDYPPVRGPPRRRY
jgi:amino acid transporter